MPSFLNEKNDQAVCYDGSYTDPERLITTSSIPNLNHQTQTVF